MPLALALEAQTTCSCPCINHSCIYKLPSLKISTNSNHYTLVPLNTQHFCQNSSNLRLLLADLPSFSQFPNDNAKHPCGHTFLLEIHSKKRKNTEQNHDKYMRFLSRVCDRAVPMNVPTSVQVHPMLVPLLVLVMVPVL